LGVRWELGVGGWKFLSGARRRPPPQRHVAGAQRRHGRLWDGLGADTVCDEVVTRSGGSFSAQVDLKGGSTTFTAYLPIDQTSDAGVTNIA